jgi:anti-sigma-K factor RskA
MAELNQDDLALAGELVLGLLSPTEEAAARARVAADTAFADEVAVWEARLQPMLNGAEAPPPPAVWEAVRAGIAPNGVQDNRRGLRFWQGLSLLSTAAALVLGLMVVLRPAPTPVPAPEPLIAALGSEQGRAAMTASFDPQSGALLVTPVSMNTGKLYPELWLIPEGGTAISLGIVDQTRPARHSIPVRLRPLMARGATLAITPEPSGGAPGGKATGPVIASGKITTI